ncbi:MAG: PD-(D/E)XK nuclease family protein [Smithellaceae bacterium]|jgi:hypothetical protein
MLFPSVTQVLSPFVDYSMIPADVLERSCLRGTAVHDACATIARGLPVMNRTPETAGYVDSYKRWFDLIVDEVLIVETRFVDIDFGFNGEPDLVIRAKNQEIILIDNKTPVQLIKSWRLQCAAYCALVSKNGIVPARSGSLRLHPDGGIARIDYYQNSLEDFNMFLQALNLYRYFNRK